MRLSIIIPTKNRYETLLPVLSALLKHIESDDYEIVIHDNSEDNSGGAHFFSEKKDLRIKYFYIKEPLSIQDNTIFAIDKARGKYLVFIGDDDLVSPCVMDVVDLMEKNGIKCLIYNPAYYWWNSVDFKKETAFHRKKAMWIPEETDLVFKEKLSKTELDFVLRNGAVSYFDLPRLYHGIVRRDIVDEIKIRTGSYVPGACPDIVLASSIALIEEKYHYLNYPVTVFGASKDSGGGMSARNAHFGKIEDMKFLPSNIISRWDFRIPKIWSAHTYYANSVLEVIKAFKSKKELNFNAFYGSMIAYEPNLKEYLAPVLNDYFKNNLSNRLIVYAIYLKKLFGIYYRNLRFNSGKIGYSVQNAENVDECMKILKKTKSLKTIDIT